MKSKKVFVCSSCGEESLTWQGKCPVCGEWNTFKEFSIGGERGSTRNSRSTSGAVATVLTKLDLQEAQAVPRISTHFEEVNRVLGGGIVPGSIILIGGEPGIGKSTLLLQVAQAVTGKHAVAYFSGEESTGQVAGRAERLGITPEFYFANETRMNIIREQITSQPIDCVVIDSIQTLYDDTFPSTPGSLVQVRECALQLQSLAKQEGIAVILVGHITKEGTVAGPKTLEHMVDVVLYLEGEARTDVRLLRSVKNRFGATFEVGLLRLDEMGMHDVADPTELFIETHVSPVAGSALTVVLEGVRPMLVELQALVVPTAFGYPKRTSSGYDLQRLQILLAILDSRVGTQFNSRDVYVNVVGDYRINDRAADLALCMALISALHEQPLPLKTVFMGEVGLTGEIRRVAQYDRRIKEIERLGYSGAPAAKTVADIGQSLGITQSKRRRNHGGE